MSVLEKKITFIISIFLELLILENVVTWIRESSSFRKLFGIKRVKGSQTLLKSARQVFYFIFPFTSKKVTCVSCLLVGSETEDRLRTRWRPITCIVVIIERNSSNKFQRSYLENKNYFLKLLLHFWNLHKILKILKTKIPFITSIFPE